MSWGKFIGTVGLFGAYLTKNFLCGVRVRSAERKQKDLPVGRSFQTVDKAPSCEGAFLVS